MAVEDITATGGHDLKGIRNPDLYQPSSTEIKVRQRAQDLSMGRVGYEDTGAPGWSTPVPMPELGDFGASRYDSDLLVNPQDQWDVANLRAANQPALAKWAAAVPQAVTTAGTTFMQGTLGLLYGAGAAIGQGEFNKLWNNDFTAAMDSVNKAVQEIAPIYQSQDEQENPLRNLFHAGPLAQNLGQLAGFIAGAAYSGAAYMKAFEFLGRGIDALRVGKGAFKAVSSLATSSKNNMATQAAASILGANGEATIEAYGNTQDWANLKKMQLEDVYRANRDDILAEASTQAAKEINPYDYETSTDYFTALELRASQIADESYKQRLAEIENASVRMGNVIWAENMALLGFTHYKTLGRIYSGGYRANKTLSNFVRKATNEAGETVLEAAPRGTFRNIVESLGKAAYEGVEEMSQSSFSKGAGYWTEKDIYEPLREKRNRQGEAETFNLITGLAEGLKDQLGDANNWVEFIMGMGAAMLPIPMPHRKSNGKIGIFKTPEMINTFRENKEMNTLAAETVDRINAMRSTPQYQTLMDALIVDAVKENKKKGSMGDQFAYKSEDFGQLVNLVTSLEQIDRVDLFTDEVDKVLEMEENDENGQAILEGLSKDGEVPDYLRNKSTIEIVREYKDKARQVREDIGRIVTNSENIRATYGDQLSNDALNSLVTLKSQLDNWNRRYKEVGKQIPDYLKTAEVDPQDHNLNVLLNSINQAQPALNFREENLEDLYKRVRSFVREKSKGHYLEDASAKRVTDDLMDMYRMGMSMRNGIVAFNAITFNPESFNQKVEKEAQKEEKKRKKENVGDLKSRFENVNTLKDLRNLEASTTPEDYTSLIKSLEDSKDPKYIELNKKKALLSNVVNAVDGLEIPEDIKSIISEVAENVIDNNPAALLATPSGAIRMNTAIKNELSRVISPEEFNLTPEQLAQLPQLIEDTITNTLTKTGETNAKVPDVAPASESPFEGDIIFDDGSVYTEAEESDSAMEEDMKEAENIVSPAKADSPNPTEAPATERPAINPDTPSPDVDTSVESYGETSGTVTEVNYHALKYTGELITPADRESWNAYARQQGMMEVNENFTRIYDYLTQKGAYSYLNKGELKSGDTVIAYIDHTFGDTIFFGKPLKDIGELQSLDDIQVLMAAPGSYKLDTKVMKSKDGQVTIGTKAHSVSQIFNGKFRFGEERALDSSVINALFPEGVRPDWTIGVISNNGQIYSNKPLSEDMIAHDLPFSANQDGRVYLFVKGPNGQYMPLSLRVLPFNGMLTGELGDKIRDAIQLMSLAADESPGNGNHPQLNSGLEALSKWVYTGNLVGVITEFRAGPGILTKHLAFLKKDKAGKVIQKEYVQLEKPTLGDRTRTQEELMEDILNALMRLGMHYQVDKNRLKTDKSYADTLMKWGLISTNVIPSPVMDTNFFLVNKVYESGRTVATPAPAPANPSTVTEVPVSTPQPARPAPKAVLGSKPFSVELFSDALASMSDNIKDLLGSLNGKSMKVERQMLLALALTADPSKFEKLGGIEALITSIIATKKDKFGKLYEDLTKKLGLNKKAILPAKIPIYSRIREALMGDPLLDSLYQADKAATSRNKDKSTTGVNKFQKDLQNTNNLLIFAELTETQRENMAQVGITEEEFNNWSKEEQQKAIECYS